MPPLGAAAPFGHLGSADSPGSPSVSGVTSFNGSTGAIGYAPVLVPASIAALSLIPTAGAVASGGLQDGQQALVGDGNALYSLQTTGATADGRYVVSTFDDAARKWIWQNYCTGFVSPEMDLKSLGATSVIVPRTLIPSGCGLSMSTTIRLLITELGGTFTGSPTFKVGNNGAHDNVFATGGSFGTAGTKNRFANGTISGTLQGLVDMSTADTVAEISVAATGSGNIKGKLVLQSCIITPVIP